MRAEPPRPQEQQERQLVPVTPTSADRGESNIHNFNCQEPGHYAPRCPLKQKGKQPAVNIITADVQQVTTRSKTKTTEWEEQDGIRKAAQEWVAKANAANVARMRQETTSAAPKDRHDTEEDPIWDILADCPITLTMSKLLDLVPRFRQAMETRVQAPRQTIPSLLTDTSSGPTIVDHRSPAIKVLIHGTEIQGCVVDGGSGVNVISKATCQTLGIMTWENCPFWLHMADTRSVRPLGLLRQLPIIIGGHSFEISAMVLALE